MNKKILFVDDAVTMRQLVSFTLNDAGYDVVTARNGDEALRKLNEYGSFSLIITDLNMPGLDGITLVRYVRDLSQHRFTPIVMLSTESQKAKQDEAKQAGVNCWIVKPFTPQQIVDLADTYVR